MLILVVKDIQSSGLARVWQNFYFWHLFCFDLLTSAEINKDSKTKVGPCWLATRR